MQNESVEKTSSGELPGFVSLQRLFIYLMSLNPISLEIDNRQSCLSWWLRVYCTVPRLGRLDVWRDGTMDHDVPHLHTVWVFPPLRHGVMLIPLVARLWTPRLGASAVHVFRKRFRRVHPESGVHMR